MRQTDLRSKLWNRLIHFVQFPEPTKKRASCSVTTLIGVLVLGLVLSGCVGGTEAAGKPGGQVFDPPPVVEEVEDDPTEPADSSEEKPELTAAEIKAQLEPSTVMVGVTVGGSDGSQNVYYGTGFVFDTSGLVITNAHVVEGAASVSVYLSGDPKPVTAAILGRSTCDDIAVLRIPGNDLVPVRIGDASELQVGDDVMVLGYPDAFAGGEELAATRGIISRLNVDAGRWDGAIQIDASIHPGNSGGPLVNSDGYVVGINSAFHGEYSGMNYSINIQNALPVIEQLSTGVDQNWLGMELEPNSPELAELYGLPSDQGMLVTFVTPGGPADQAGLVPGDVILTMEGLAVYSMSDVCDITKTHSVHGFPKIELAQSSNQGEPEAETAPDDPPVEPESPDVPDAPVTPDAPDAPDTSETDGGLETVSAYDFEDGTAPWSLGEGYGFHQDVRDGALVFDAIGEDYMTVVSLPESEDHSDGVISASVEMFGEGEIGLTARFTTGDDGGWNTYLCSISYNGQFSCWSAVNHEFLALADWQEHPAISIGSVNQIAMAMSGGALTFAINGEVVAQLSDDDVAAGSWGIFVQNYAPDFQALIHDVAMASINH